MARDACACLFVLVDKHRLYKSWYRNILLSFSILILSNSGLEFVFLIIIWKFCGNRCPPFSQMRQHLMRSTPAAVPISLCFLSISWSLQIPSTLPVFVPPSSEPLNTIRRKLQCSRVRRSKGTPESKYSRQRRATHMFSCTQFSHPSAPRPRTSTCSCECILRPHRP